MIHLLVNVRCPSCDKMHALYNCDLFVVTHEYKFTCPETEEEAIIRGDASGQTMMAPKWAIECFEVKNSN